MSIYVKNQKHIDSYTQMSNNTSVNYLLLREFEVMAD